MLSHIWRVFLVVVLGFGTFAAVNVGSTAVAVERTVTQSVSLTVPGAQIAELCASGEINQCVTIGAGPAAVSGTLTVTVSTPGVTPVVDVGTCGTAGVRITAGGATQGGTIAATFSGTVTPPGSTVERTIQINAPSESDTLEASVCLSRG